MTTQISKCSDGGVSGEGMSGAGLTGEPGHGKEWAPPGMGTMYTKKWKLLKKKKNVSNTES